MAHKILPRSAWSSTAARGTGITWSRVRGIVCHYPAMGRAVGVLTQAQEAARLRGWRSYHVNSLGWKDIGYSYAIGQSGRIYSLRGDRVGGHTYGHNSTTLGVLFIVGDNEPLTAAAKAAFRALRATLRKRGASSGVWGHREMSGNSTRCPGPYIMGSIRSGELTGSSAGASKPSTTAPSSSRPWRTSPRVSRMPKAEVRSIQQTLTDLGYSLGSYGVDGSYGDATGNAVKALQADLNITADGVYGPGTEKALMSKLNAIEKKVDRSIAIATVNQRRIDRITRTLEPGISGKRTDGEAIHALRKFRNDIRNDIAKIPADVLDEPVALEGKWKGQKGSLRGVRAWYAEDMRALRALVTASEAAVLEAVQESGRAQGLTDEQVQAIATAAAEASARVSAEDVAGQLEVGVRTDTEG